MALTEVGCGRLRAVAWTASLVALAACKENLSRPVASFGPDTLGPAVQLHPAHDTLVDSVGTLLVRATVTDPSGVKSLTFVVLPAGSTPPTVMGVDTTIDVFFPVTLSVHKHATFKYYVQAIDILDHETVSDTVTVTVR